MKAKTTISGYVIQLYQFAIRYDYNNRSLLDYFNSNKGDEKYNPSDDEDYITLGYYDLIEINPVYSFRKYHDISKYAKCWIGKRQCVLLYDVSNDACPCRLYYKKQSPADESNVASSDATARGKARTNHWESQCPDYIDVDNRRFFCLTMLSLTNDILANSKDCSKLLRAIRERILQIVDSINSIDGVDVACEVYGTFNTSEVAIVWLADQYVDVLLALEYIKHLTIEDGESGAHHLFMTTFSTISMKSSLNAEDLEDVRGDAHLQLSFNDERYGYRDLESVKEELVKICTEPGKRATSISAVGEYDCVITSSAKSILSIILPYNGKSDLLQIGIRDKSNGGIFCDQEIRTILRNNTRLLVGSGENEALKLRLESFMDDGAYTIRAEGLLASPVTSPGSEERCLLSANRLLYFESLREKIKGAVNPSTGTVDTLDLLVTDYQSVIATAYNRTWVEDIHAQFNGVMESIDRLVETEKTNSVRFWNEYKDLTNAFKQQIYHLTQSSRMFFETPSSHLRATGQYDFLMHACYGIAKRVIESIYLMQEMDEQSELIPLITVNTEPQIISELFYEYQKNDARIINLIVPNTVITDPYRGILYLCHELYHYCVPTDRVERNYRLGAFSLCNEFKDQILAVFKRIMLENCPKGLAEPLQELLRFSSRESSQLFLSPADRTLSSFDYWLMTYLLSERCYKHVGAFVDNYGDRRGGKDALKSAYLKQLGEFFNTEKSDALFLELFKNLFKDMERIFNASSQHALDQQIPTDDKRRDALKWVGSRFDYYASINTDVTRRDAFLEKVLRYRKLERPIITDETIGTSLSPATLSLCKAVDEAHSDVASITLTGYSLTDYILYFIKNVCDLKRENDPDRIIIDDHQALRFSLVVDYCREEGIDKEFCCRGIPNTNNRLIQGADLEYFTKVFPWVFLGSKTDLASHNERIVTQLHTFHEYSIRWINKISDMYIDYLMNMRIYYTNLFKPILDTANIIKRHEQLEKRKDERAEKLCEIRTIFMGCIHEYSDFRKQLCEISKLDNDTYETILSNRFKLDLSIVQRFQNQKSLYHLRGVNEKIRNALQENYRGVDRGVKYVSDVSPNVESGMTTMGNDEKHKQRFLIYSWNELQFYLNYCTNEFKKQLEALGFKDGMYSQIWYRGETTTDEQEHKLWPLSYRHFHPNENGANPAKSRPRDSYKTYCHYQRSQFDYFKTLVDGAFEAPAYGTLALCDYVALMQHYGLKTNLLDFTDNAFIALYIALKYFSREDNENKKQRDVALYLFSPVIYNLYREKRMQDDIDTICDTERDDDKREQLRSKLRELYCIGDILTFNGPVPNLSIPKNESLYARYIFGNDALDQVFSHDDDDGCRRSALPVAVWTPRINTRIRTQSGSFVAFDLYTEINDENCHLMKLQDKEIEDNKDPYIFLFKLGVAKESCLDVYNTISIMGMNQQFVYPELDKTIKRFT